MKLATFAHRAAQAAVLTGTLMIASACNMFDLLDKPSGDDQLLSAGYACLDNGDAVCAAEYFGQVAPGNERAEAAEAFAILDGRSMGMREFIQAFGSKNPTSGKAMTRLINTLAAAGQTTSDARNAFHQAFLKTQNITTQVQLKGLVRLVSASAIMASVLALDAGSDAVFVPAELVDNTTTCNSTSCVGGGGCAYTATNITAATAITGNDRISTTANALTGTPDLAWVYQAIKEINLAVGSTELDVRGGIGNSLSQFTSDALASAAFDASSGRCLRASLLNLQVGVLE